MKKIDVEEKLHWIVAGIYTAGYMDGQLDTKVRVEVIEKGEEEIIEIFKKRVRA